MRDSSGGPENEVPSIDAPRASMNTTKNPKSFAFGDDSIQAMPHSNHRTAYLMSRDPMEEFFELTCKSIILNSPHMNAICTVNTKELYSRALKTSTPFFKWQTWIEKTLNKEFLRIVLRQGKGARKIESQKIK